MTTLKWNDIAADSNGKRSYTAHPSIGEFHIAPLQSQFGRHQGYTLQFANTGGADLPHGGLWWSVSAEGEAVGLHSTHLFRSPASAKTAAKKFLERYGTR